MAFWDFIMAKKSNYGETTFIQSPIDSEIELVNRISNADMEQFDMIPYHLEGPVKKYTKDGGHPFAYIEIDEINQRCAVIALSEINTYISQSKNYCPVIPHDLEIPIDQIKFSEYAPNYGYSRLMCTPYTSTGKISKYPLSLFFTTDLRKQNYTSGELFYGRDGNIMKGKVNIWRDSVFFQYNFQTIGRSLVIKDIKSNLVQDEHGMATTIYHFQK